MVKTFLEQFKEGDIVVTCVTEKDMISFLSDLSNEGVSWVTGKHLLSVNGLWDVYGDITSFRYSHNGGLTHGKKAAFSTKASTFIDYGAITDSLERVNNKIDEHKPSLLVNDISKLDLDAPDHHPHVKGVTWNRNKCKWEVRLTVNSERKRIGYYPDECSAIKARVAAEITYFGKPLDLPFEC